MAVTKNVTANFYGFKITDSDDTVI